MPVDIPLNHVGPVLEAVVEVRMEGITHLPLVRCDGPARRQ